MLILDSSSTAPSSSSSNLPHGIFNDSSVAIVALGNGDKRLLYQENTGNIREALYTASSNQWTSDINNIVATNAKNSTPLAALLVNSTGTPFAADTGPVVFLFYIAQNNVLASRQFISGAWTTRDNFSPTGSANSTFPTAPNTRTLAVTSIANSTISGEAYVFYVAQNGSATALTIVPDVAGDGIVANPGPRLPDSLQGGYILALAAGITGSRPQVGVLTSNGTVYYSLYFSFFSNNSWTAPEREFSSREWILHSLTQVNSSNTSCTSSPTIRANYIPHKPNSRKCLPRNSHPSGTCTHAYQHYSRLQRDPTRRRRHRASLRQQPELGFLHSLRFLGQRN